TSKGLIKKTERSLYESSKVSKLMAILLNEGDKITNIMEINDNKHIMLYTRYGKCLSMNIDEISTTGRMTKGVMSMNLEDDNDYVTEMLILSDEFKYLTVITERGYMKKCDLYTLPISGRNGNVYPIATTTKDNRIFKVILSNDNDILNVVTTEEKYEVNVNSVNELTRLSKCERLKDVKFKVVERLIRVSVN
ncbi:MAG: DNA gyrase C-terminal beta-propeller domain-containing protein, partial [Paraclostridium sp.]